MIEKIFTESNSTYFYAIGKRKTSIAQVFLKAGNGKILINNKDHSLFLENLGPEKEMIKKPLLLVNAQNMYDIIVKVQGGGSNSQLNAIILGISKALSRVNLSFRKTLNQNFLLRCDSRIKERRKYGLKKARKASQYSKR